MQYSGWSPTLGYLPSADGLLPTPFQLNESQCLAYASPPRGFSEADWAPHPAPFSLEQLQARDAFLRAVQISLRRTMSFLSKQNELAESPTVVYGMRLYNQHWPPPLAVPTVDWDLMSVNPEQDALWVCQRLQCEFHERKWVVRKNLMARSYQVVSLHGAQGAVANLIDISYMPASVFDSRDWSEHSIDIGDGSSGNLLFLGLRTALSLTQATLISGLAPHRRERDISVLNRLAFASSLGIGSDELRSLTLEMIVARLPSDVSEQVLRGVIFLNGREADPNASNALAGPPEVLTCSEFTQTESDVAPRPCDHSKTDVGCSCPDETNGWSGLKVTLTSVGCQAGLLVSRKPATTQTDPSQEEELKSRLAQATADLEATRQALARATEERAKLSQRLERSVEDSAVQVPQDFEHDGSGRTRANSEPARRPFFSAGFKSWRPDGNFWMQLSVCFPCLLLLNTVALAVYDGLVR